MTRLGVKAVAFVCSVLAAVVLASVPATPAQAAEDELSFGTGFAAPGAIAHMPVYVRDVSGTPLNAGTAARIGEVSFVANFTNFTYIDGCDATPFPTCQMTFVPAGVLENLTPSVAEVSTSANSVSVRFLYNEVIAFTLNRASPGDLIGYLDMAIDATAPAGEEVVFTFDSAADLTFLRQQASGPTSESVGAGLIVSGGRVQLLPCVVPPESLSITWSSNTCTSPSTSCRTGESIAFAPAGHALQACDSVLWEFGDETISTDGTPTHSFDTSETYTVRLTVTNSSGTRTVEQSLTIASPCVAPPESLAIGWTGGCAFPTTSCETGSSIDLSPSGYTYQECDSVLWNFGDGNTSTQRTPSHTFATSGTRKVRLTVTNPAGERTAEQTLTFMPPCVAPAASLVIESSGGTTANQPISFFVSGYTYQECDSVLWDFSGEGTSTSRIPSFTFVTSGTKTIRFTVTNQAGTVTKDRTLMIIDVPPPCAPPTLSTITWTGSNGCNSDGGSQCAVNRAIAFRPGSYVYQGCDSAFWQFGDDTTSTSRFPSKSFSSSGTYLVTLTISNSSGTITKERSIVIQPGGAGSCTGVPTEFQVGFTVTGPGCNSLGCSPVFPITFTAYDFPPFYTFQSCDVISWMFDDDSPTLQGRVVQHQFSQGTYDVTMRVSNPIGSVTVGQSVIVGSVPLKVPCPCTATAPAVGYLGEHINFSGQPGECENPFPEWNFGDGPDRTFNYSVTHSYTAIGTYPWSFKVSAFDRPTCEVKGTIEIKRPPKRRAVRSGEGGR